MTLALLGLVAVWAVWATMEGLRVRDGARDLEASARGLSAAVEAQDWSATAARGDDVVQAARRTDDAASSPPLRLASVLPVVGDDVTAVRTVASSARSIAEDGLAPLLEAALAGEGPEGLIRDGRVDVDALTRLQPAAAAASQAVTAADGDLSGLDTGNLVERVRVPVDQATAQIRAARGPLASLDTATRLLPPMLGAEAPREYLLMFQNLAEARPTGGIFGSWALVSATDGRIELLETGVNDDLGQLGLDQSQIDPTVTALYGPDVALSQNMNLSADFPTAARLLSQLSVSRGREAPDGVVSLDPVVLAAILSATGPVDVPGGPALDGDNAVQVLQRDAYTLLGGDTVARETYLGAAVAAVFDRLVADASLRLGSAMAEPVRRGHVQVWSADPTEQAVIAATPVSGALPAPDAGTVGVFTTNTDASKLDHYMTRSVRIRGGCGAPPELVLELRNDAPASVVEYVAAKDPDGDVADPPTTHSLLVSLYLPPERGVSELTVGGVATPFSADTELGWTLVRVPVQVAAGTAAAVRVVLSGEASAPATVLPAPATIATEITLPRCTG